MWTTQDGHAPRNAGTARSEVHSQEIDDQGLQLQEPKADRGLAANAVRRMNMALAQLMGKSVMNAKA
jgi:hypothetical protein